jgi:ribonuclease Z
VWSQVVTGVREREVSGRELVVLGTASQVPTRDRAHNGYLLRWDAVSVLFDPGEGTQRQLTLAGERATPIRHVLITHAHGDHCLGLPGVLQRLSLDGAPGPVHVRFPAEAAAHIGRLRHAIPYQDHTEVVLHPDAPGLVVTDDAFAIRAVALSHGQATHPVPTLAWRIEEPDGRRFLVAELEARAIPPAARGELAATGHVRVGGRRIDVEEVSVPRRGQHVAFVMDTRDGDGAREAAADVDLLVIEATFLDDQRGLAEQVGHLTARQAATIGRDAGARRVVLTHLSQRYPTLEGHEAEARDAAPELDLIVARDLDRVPLPPRR